MATATPDQAERMQRVFNLERRAWELDCLAADLRRAGLSGGPEGADDVQEAADEYWIAAAMLRAGEPAS